MKNNVCKFVAIAMLATTFLSGCNSAQLNLNSDDDTPTEESTEEISEDNEDASSDDLAEDTSKDDESDKTDVSTQDSSEDNDEDDSKKTSSTKSIEELSDYDSAETMEGDELSSSELEKLEEYLNQIDNYGFTLASYKNADQIDWGDVLAYGAGIENCDYSQEAVDAYLEASDEFDAVEYDLIALSGEDVRAFVEDKTGITDFDASLVSDFVYVEEYDIFFSQVSDCYMKDVRCEAGVRNGDVLQIIFHVGFQTNNRRLTIEATGDSDNPYRFFSNRELWEENAIKVIDAAIYQNTGTITCAVVDSDKGPDIEIIVDNVVTCVAHPRFRDSEDINIEQYSDVVEVEFWDVDDDGVADMIVILSDGDDSVAVLCKGYVNQWSEGYTEPKAEVTKWLSENVSDMTADNAISYILDHKDEFNDI